MHAYSIWSREHNYVLFVMAVISIAATYVLNFVFSFIPGEIAAPSAFAIYGSLFLGFDRLFWRWQIFRRIRLVRTPDFNGEWEGVFQSSLTPEKQLNGVLEVSQTWTNISLFFDGAENQCHSQVASISSFNSNRWKFSWQYKSTIKDRNTAEGVGEDRIHYGTSMVVATTEGTDSPKQMVGHYYTDKKRKSYGQLEFIKKAVDNSKN